MTRWPCRQSKTVRRGDVRSLALLAAVLLPALASAQGADPGAGTYSPPPLPPTGDVVPPPLPPTGTSGAAASDFVPLPEAAAAPGSAVAKACLRGAVSACDAAAGEAERAGQPQDATAYRARAAALRRADEDLERCRRQTQGVQDDVAERDPSRAGDPCWAPTRADVLARPLGAPDDVAALDVATRQAAAAAGWLPVGANATPSRLGAPVSPGSPPSTRPSGAPSTPAPASVSTGLDVSRFGVVALLGVDWSVAGSSPSGLRFGLGGRMALVPRDGGGDAWLPAVALLGGGLLGSAGGIFGEARLEWLEVSAGGPCQPAVSLYGLGGVQGASTLRGGLGAAPYLGLGFGWDVSPQHSPLPFSIGPGSWEGLLVGLVLLPVIFAGRIELRYYWPSASAGLPGGLNLLVGFGF